MRRLAIRFRINASIAAASCSSLLILGLAGASAGQDALGSGNALDANLSTRTRSNAPVNRTDYRARNLLITNDVAGGRGFRGSVGYEAAGDFSGRLGSNDLFSFRADSAFSDASLIRYGNAYTQLRLGGSGGPVEYYRSGYAPSILTMQTGTNTIVDRAGEASARSMLDRISTQRLSTNQSLAGAPQSVGVVYDDLGQPNVVESSPLRGLIYRPFEDAAGTGDGGRGSLLERAAARGGRDPDMTASRREQVAAPFTTLKVNERNNAMDENASARLDRADDGGRVDTASARSRDQYARVLQAVVDRYANAQNVDMHMDETMLRQLGIEYDRLRNQLAMADPAADASRTDDPLDPDDPRANETGDMTANRGTDRTSLVQPEDDAAIAEFQIVLNHNAVIDTLVGEEKDRFNEIIAEGEQRLRIGEFFLAERSFERALRMVRGHPLATAGFGHAQLGAGLYRSANHTLRSLLTAHPAMIDVRYQTGLIPNRIRLLNAVAKLEERLAEEDFDRDLNGFLIAYIGHQIEDKDLVTRGLDAMLAANANDPLVPVLRAVWMAEDGEAIDADAPASDGESASDGDG